MQTDPGRGGRTVLSRLAQEGELSASERQEGRPLVRKYCIREWFWFSNIPTFWIISLTQVTVKRATVVDERGSSTADTTGRSS